MQLGSHQIMFALNHQIQAIIPLYDPGLRNGWEKVSPSSNPSLMTKYATKDCVTPNFQPLQNVANHQLKCFLPKFCLETCWGRVKMTKTRWHPIVLFPLNNEILWSQKEVGAGDNLKKGETQMWKGWVRPEKGKRGHSKTSAFCTSVPPLLAYY